MSASNVLPFPSRDAELQARLEQVAKRKYEVITIGEGDQFFFEDEQGHRLVDVEFELDPTGNLINITVRDTQGNITSHLAVCYLGKGYFESEEQP